MALVSSAYSVWAEQYMFRAGEGAKTARKRARAAKRRRQELERKGAKTEKLLVEERSKAQARRLSRLSEKAAAQLFSQTESASGTAVELTMRFKFLLEDPRA